MMSEHHRQRRHEQDERRDRGEGDVEDLGCGWSVARSSPVEEEGRDQGAEEQALRAEEHPHRHLANVGRIVGVLLVDGGTHPWSSLVSGSIDHPNRPHRVTTAPPPTTLRPHGRETRPTTITKIPAALS